MSIDGKSHEDILLVAVFSGFVIAVIILIIVTTNLLQLHKRFYWNQKDSNMKLAMSPEAELYCVSTLSEKKITSKTNLLNIFRRSQSFDLSQCITPSIATSCNEFGAVFKNVSGTDCYCNKLTLNPSMFDTSIKIETVAC